MHRNNNSFCFAFSILSSVVISCVVVSCMCRCCPVARLLESLCLILVAVSVGGCKTTGMRVVITVRLPDIHVLRSHISDVLLTAEVGSEIDRVADSVPKRLSGARDEGDRRNTKTRFGRARSLLINIPDGR